MNKTRFTPWVVLACIGTLASCTSGEGGTAGNTELNVMIPTGGGSTLPDGTPVPADVDIQVVEYTINCDAPDPTASGLGVDSIEPTFNPDVTINGVLEVLDTASGAVSTQDFGVNLDEVYVWQGFMDIPMEALCTVQLRARDNGNEVICTDTVDFDTLTDAAFGVGDTVKVNVLMYCGISFQAPVAMLDLDGDFSFNIANFCPDLFILNCVDSELNIQQTQIGPVLATACQVRFRDGDNQCGDSCDPQNCVATPEGLSCFASPERGVCNGGNSGVDGFPCFETVCNGGDRDTLPCRDDLECQGTSPTPDGTCNGPPCPGSSPTPDGTCELTGPRTTVTCASQSGTCAIDCDGVPNFVCAAGPAQGTFCNPLDPAICQGEACVGTSDTECVFNGDTLGQVGAPAPGPFAPGEGGFFVNCAQVGGIAVAPGDQITCTAKTTDYDEDCDKEKEVPLTVIGLSACQTFGGDAACSDQSINPLASVCNEDVCNPSACDGSDPALCCTKTANDAMDGTECNDEDPPLAECQSGVCTPTSCGSDAECNDTPPNQCLEALECDEGTGFCCLDGNASGCAANEPAPAVSPGATCDTTTITDGVCNAVCSDDGSACGIDDDCTAGTCSVGGGTCIAVVCDPTDDSGCTAPTTVCQVVDCVSPPVEGECATSDVANAVCQGGGGGNDGDACTADDDCDGTCDFTNSTACSTCVGGDNEGAECTTSSALCTGGGTCTASTCINGSCKGIAPDLPAASVSIPNACRVGGAGGEVLTALPIVIELDPTPIEAGESFDVTLTQALAPVAQSFLQAAVNLIGTLEIAFINPGTQVTVGPSSGGDTNPFCEGGTEDGQPCDTAPLVTACDDGGGDCNPGNLVTTGYLYPTQVDFELESADGAPFPNTAGTYNCYRTERPGPPTLPDDTKVLSLACVGGNNAGSCCQPDDLDPGEYALGCPVPSDCTDGGGTCEPALLLGTKPCGISCNPTTESDCNVEGCGGGTVGNNFAGCDPDGPGDTDFASAPLVLAPSLASFVPDGSGQACDGGARLGLACTDAATDCDVCDGGVTPGVPCTIPGFNTTECPFGTCTIDHACVTVPDVQTFTVTAASGDICFETVGSTVSQDTFINVGVGGGINAPIFCGPGVLENDDSITPLTDADRVCFPITP